MESVEDRMLEFEAEYQALPPWRQFLVRWTAFIAAGIAAVVLLWRSL